MAQTQAKLGVAQIAQILFKILQCVHHLSNVGFPGQQSSWPKSFLDKFHSLGKFLRPGMPNQHFDRAYQNLRFTFLANMVSLLRCHYFYQMDNLASKLLTSKLSNTAIQEAMLLSKKWAKARLGKKLKQSTIITWQTAIQNFSKQKHGRFSNYLATNTLTTSHPHNNHFHTNTQTPINTHKHTQPQNPWVKGTYKPRNTPQTYSTRTHNRFSVLTENQSHTQTQTKSHTSNQSETKHTPNTQTRTWKNVVMATPNQNNTLTSSNKTALLAKTPLATQKPCCTGLPATSPHTLSRRNSLTPSNSPNLAKTSSPNPGRSGLPHTTPSTGSRHGSTTPSNNPDRSYLSAVTSTKRAQSVPSPQIPGTSSTTSYFTPRYSQHLLCHSELEPIDISSTCERSEYQYLSNFHIYPTQQQLVIDGEQFRSSEIAYHYKKLTFLGLPKIATQVTTILNGRRIKNFVKQDFIRNHPKIGDWDKIKGNYMRQLVEERSRQDQSFADLLLGTYPHPLTHNIPDNFWGSKGIRGQKPKDAFAVILMEVRYQLAIEKGWAAESFTSSLLDEEEFPPLGNSPDPKQQQLPNNQDPTKKNKGPGKKSKPKNTTNHTPSNGAESPALGNSPHLGLTTQHIQDQSQNHGPGKTPTQAKKSTSTSSSKTRAGTNTQALGTTKSKSQKSPSKAKQASTIKVLGPNKIYHRVIHKSQWLLPHIHEKVAIIGDSNINRMQYTSEELTSVVLHSFPGAKLADHSKLFPRGKTQDTPSQVIINLGINDRSLRKTSLKDQLGKLIKSATTYFPKSDIYIAQVNYSKKLNTEECENLKHLNMLIAQTCHSHKNEKVKFIPALSQNETFTTDKRDKTYIHWSENTANMILKHWCIYLNLI